MNTHGLLLVAHGSKDPEWTIPFEAIEDFTKREFPGPVVLAYLESASPRIEQGITELLSSGVTNIAVAPLFFAVGNHVRKDIPLIIQKAVKGHPRVSFRILPAVGQIPAVQRLISSEVVTQAALGVVPGLQQVSEEIAIAAQIQVEHVQDARNLGFKSIICTRPDEEEGEHQTPQKEIAQACERLGLEFTYFPISFIDHTERQARIMRDYVNQFAKPVLVYCRNGQQSIALLAHSKELLDLYHPESFC